MPPSWSRTHAPPQPRSNPAPPSSSQGKNVLRKEPMSRDVADGDVFSVNDAFQSKLYKVKIGMVAAQRDSDEGREEARERVEEDRKPQIEAAIVRIMKARPERGEPSARVFVCGPACARRRG